MVLVRLLATSLFKVGRGERCGAGVRAFAHYISLLLIVAAVFVVVAVVVVSEMLQ